jgi:hypothetical protein
MREMRGAKLEEGVRRVDSMSCKAGVTPVPPTIYQVEIEPLSARRQERKGEDRRTKTISSN